MAFYAVYFLICFAGFVLTKEGSLFDPCLKTDKTCLSKATQTFIERSYQGLPQYDIKAIDPLIIPSLDVDVDDHIGLRFHFKNIKVVGLKDLKFHDYNMDTANRSVVFKTKADINLTSDITIELTKSKKSFPGEYFAALSVLGNSQYGYSLKKNNKDGLNYFEVDAEITTCEIIGEPKVTLGQTLQKLLYNDFNARNLKSDYEARAVVLRKKTLCKIVENAYSTIIHNLKAIAKILPTNAFFKDV